MTSPAAPASPLANPTPADLAAAAEGYRHAVRFATEMGIGAYERIGFRVTDGRINRYLWRSG